MSQLERIVFINRMIEETGGVRTSRIEKEFSISRRQVLRDIAYLRNQLRAPLVYDRDRKWYHYKEPFTLFSNTNERMLVLNAIVRSLAQSQGIMANLTQMISEGIDSGVEKHYRSLSEKIIFITPVQDWPDYEIFNKICSAMKSEERMSMHYCNAFGVHSHRHIEPLRLVNYSGRWYLLAYDLQHKQLRTFHLSRIEQLAQIEGDRMKQRFSDEELDAFIHAGYGIFMGKEVTYVTFRVYGWAIHALSTQSWHPEQTQRIVQDQGKEALEVTIPVSNLQEVLAALLSYGPDARPIAPEAFVQRYKQLVERMGEMIKTL
ncbi:MAG: helix-turn-helix transcriptional regulator [Sphaerochaetaceae bacterium]